VKYLSCVTYTSGNMIMFVLIHYDLSILLEMFDVNTPCNSPDSLWNSNHNSMAEKE